MGLTGKLKDKKVPIVTINKKLNELDNKVLFPEKLEKAKKMLKEKGLPKP